MCLIACSEYVLYINKYILHDRIVFSITPCLISFHLQNGSSSHAVVWLDPGGIPGGAYGPPSRSISPSSDSRDAGEKQSRSSWIELATYYILASNDIKCNHQYQ